MDLRRWAGRVLLACAVLSAAASVRAQDLQESARRHFKSGVALFQNNDFTGALVEFEASHRDRPGASSLQNMALCLTRLHRYLPALETLDKLKADFGGSLSADDRKAVDDSIRELSQLVGTVTLRLRPASAQVSINGKPVSPDALTKPIRLASGEYVFKVEAPSHTPLERTEKIAGGDDRVIEVELAQHAGEVDIYASDREAAIAIDSLPVAFGAWSGPLAPGEHLVQVYKQGFRPFATRIPVKAGDHIELRPLLGPPDRSPLSLVAPTSAPQLVSPRGWYALFTANTLVPLYHPDGFKSGDMWTGGAYGLRGGYRFWQNVAFEALFDSGKQSVGPGDYQGSRAYYDLTSTRLGGNVRLLSGGRSARLSAVFGVGSVTHTLEIAEKSGKGGDGYFMLEIGAQFDLGHVLLEAAAITFMEGAAGVKQDKEGGGRMYTGHTFVPHVGIGFRAGYSEWGRW